MFGACTLQKLCVSVCAQFVYRSKNSTVFMGAKELNFYIFIVMERAVRTF